MSIRKRAETKKYKTDKCMVSSGASDTLLRIERVNYSIEGRPILKNISLQVHKGEFIGLIGPNGAGKTTLLKCINGINKADGLIELGGIGLDSMNSRAIASRAAMLHQETYVSFPFTALSVVLCGRYPKLGRLRAETAEDYETALKCMEYTGTVAMKDRLINTLSGGERQRVLFAKVLAQETDLILLDEPSASLDIAHEEQLFKYSGELCKNGKAVIAAVHDLKTALKYCTRLVLMKDGEIIADGAPESVVTKDNLSRAYGVNALVYKNRVTGLIDFHIPGQKSGDGNALVHVIGGGGSSSGIIRQLYEEGFSITAGVFAHGDSDLECADIFGIKSLVSQPFSEIDEDTFKSNVELVKAADITILCDMPFGKQNIRNLEAASYSKQLIIIEDTAPESRDFTGGKALDIYNRLREHAIVTGSAKLHEVLP